MSDGLRRVFGLTDELFVSLRERRVPEAGMIDALLEAIGELEAAYRERDSLPKELVGVMIDMATALYGATDAHPEPAHTALYHQFDHITDRMRDLCL